MATTPVEECQRAAFSREAESHAELWTNLIPDALKSSGNETAIADLAVQELPRICSSQALQIASHGVLKAALQGDDFKKAFAVACLKAGSSVTNTTPPNLILILLQWSSLAIDSLDQEAGAKAIIKLIEVQAKLMQHLVSRKKGQARSRTAVRLAGAALRQRPTLLPRYIDLLKSSASPFYAWISLCARSCAGSKPGEPDAQAATASLEVYCGDRALLSREPPAVEQRCAWRAVAAAWSPDELVATLAPAGDRALKRNPEPALRWLTPVIEGLSAAAAEALLSPLLGQVMALAKHARESTREAALTALQAASDALPPIAVARADACQAAVDLFAGRGPDGKIKAVQEREGVARAAAMLSPSSRSIAAGLAAVMHPEELPGAMELVDAAVAAAAGEPNERARVLLLEAAVAWAPHAADGPVPGASLPLLLAGVKDPKEGPRRACLALVAALVASPARVPERAASLGASRIVPGLVDVVQTAVAKAALRQDGVLAAGALIHIALACEQVLNAHGKTVASACASALCAPETAARLPETAAGVAADLAAVLLVRAAAFALDTDAQTVLFRTIALLALHRTRAVRVAALSSIAAVVGEESVASPAETGITDGLLQGLQYWATHRNDGALTDVCCGAATESDVEHEDRSVARRFLAAIRASLPIDGVGAGDAEKRPGLSGEGLAAVAILAHGQPLERSGAEPGTISKAWRRLLGQGVSASGVGTLLARSARCAGPAAIEKIVRPLVVDDSAPQPAANLGALRVIVALDAERLVPAALSALRPLLDVRAHDALTRLQIRTYFTPPGRLASETDEGGIMPAEILERVLASSKTGGASPVPSAIADFLAKNPPPSPAPASASATKTTASAAKKGAGTNGAAATRPTTAPNARGGSGKGTAAGAKPTGEKALGGSAARQRQLDSEERERTAVRLLVRRLSRALLALAAVAAADGAETRRSLEELLEPALPFLGSPLVGEGGAAGRVLLALTSSLPSGLATRSADVAAALRLVLVAERDAGLAGESSPAYDALLSRRCFKSALMAVHRSVGGAMADGETYAYAGDMPLPAPVVVFLFPLLRAALGTRSATALQGVALDVIGLHLDALPSAPTARLLVQTLEKFPAFKNRATAMLCALSGRLEDPVADAEGIAALADGLAASRAGTRAAALKALSALRPLREGPLAHGLELRCALWVARSDPVPDNAAAAIALWGLVTDPSAPWPWPPEGEPSGALQRIVEHYLVSPIADVRAAGAAALAAALLVARPGAPELALRLCLSRFSPGDKSAALGATAGVEAIAPQLSLDLAAGPALGLVLDEGLRASSEAVRSAAVRCGCAVVDAHGRAGAERLLAPLEARLADARRGGRLSEAQADHVRQGTIILLGTVARHLPPESPRIRAIVATLLEVLSTPSAAVQREASDCLPPLVRALQGDRAYVESVVTGLLRRCLDSASYGERRGAAFGLAGAVKGLGIGSLKGLGVLDELSAALAGTKPTAKEGALMAYERLSARLGRLFEPYVKALLPALLAAYNDGSGAVREAAAAAARAIMGNLSAQGVRLVLPALLEGLGDTAQWRTRQGSIRLLGSMASCNPRQLGAALPSVVPLLAEAMGDAQPKVADAATKALDEVVGVVSNPEVKRLVPQLLATLRDPAKHTRKTLDVLLSTVFVNTVDPPSLALIVPVVRRGLRERSGDVKKRSARIIGNLSSLVNDPADMAPYMEELLPDLHTALVDPLPEVRATAAKALGALVRGLGPRAKPFAALVPRLLGELRSETSVVERSGAAQGLAEVLSVEGGPAVEALLPRILEAAAAPSPAAREGAVTLFKYLPGCMPDEFRPLLPRVLPCVLRGLADEAEGVRDAALSAARVAVDIYATAAVEELLPTVEAGVRNSSWRIRQSSIELLGDLLFKVAGATGRVQQDLRDDEGEGISVEAHGKAITAALGAERRAEILAALYIARSDEAFGVRSASLHVWKTVVTNTPKTLGEILPALVARVIDSLGDVGEDSRAAAGRCLGELVRKMGDRVLVKIVPILREGMDDPRPHIRQGVCSGLRDVLENADREQLAEHLPALLPAVQAALCDADPDVRAAAGGVFNVVSRGGTGGGPLDSILPPLLETLEADGQPARQARALEGLRVMLGVRPSLLATVVPRLLRPPAGAVRLRALGALADVAGPNLHAQLGSILPPLLSLAAAHPDVSPAAAAAHEALKAVVLAVQEEGLYQLVAELLKGLDGDATRAGAAEAIAVLARGSKCDLQEHGADLVGALVPCLADDRDDDALRACLDALAAVLGALPKEVQPNYVRALKDAVLVARDKQRRKKKEGPLLLPGLCLPKAVGPLLPIYLQGILQGSAELKEAAAEGLGQLIEVTSEETFRPHVVQSTGPLIRIIGDRFPWQVKAAILKTLGILIAKAGVGLKPFVPQLQTTFMKCLLDAEPRVRGLAAANLGALSALSPRLDMLLTDLANAARGAATPEATLPYLAALERALVVSGARASPETLAKVEAGLLDALARAGEDEAARAAAAGTLGALGTHVSPHEARSMLARAGAIGTSGPAASAKLGDRLGAAFAAAAAARHAPALVAEGGLADELVAAVTARFARDPNHLVRQAAARAGGSVVLSQLRESATRGQSPPESPALARLVPVFVSLLGTDQDIDVQRTAISVLRQVAAGAEDAPAALAPHFGDLVPSLLAVISASTSTARLNAERTLSRVMGMAGGDETLVRAFLASGGSSAVVARQLTETYIRRLAKLPPSDDEDAEEDAI